MTDDTENRISGEERLKQRRNKLVMFTLLGCVAVFLIGFTTGYVGNLYESGTISPLAVVLLWALGVIAIIWLNVGYFRRVDELDREDNIIAALASFCFFFIAYPSWYMFQEIGMLPEIEWHVIYVATLSVGVLAYFARKLGWR